MNPEAWRILGAIMAVIGGFRALACLCEREKLKEHEHLRVFVLSTILFVTGLLVIIVSMANIERKSTPNRQPVQPLQQREFVPEDRPTSGQFAEFPTRFFILKTISLSPNSDLKKLLRCSGDSPCFFIFS